MSPEQNTEAMRERLISTILELTHEQRVQLLDMLKAEGYAVDTEQED